MRWPGYPRYRDVSALFSVVYSAVLFALQAMRIETQPALRGRSEFKGLEFVLGRGLLGADGHDLVGAHHTDGNQVLALGFTGFLACGTPSSEYPPPLSTRSTKLPLPDTSTSTSMAWRSFMSLELLPEAE